MDGAAFADSVDLSVVLLDSRAALSWWIPTAKLVTDVDGAGSSERRGCPGGFEGAAVLVDCPAFADSVDLSVVLVDSRARLSWWTSGLVRRGRRGLDLRALRARSSGLVLVDSRARLSWWTVRPSRTRLTSELSWWIRGRGCPGGLSGLPATAGLDRGEGAKLRPCPGGFEVDVGCLVDSRAAAGGFAGSDREAGDRRGRRGKLRAARLSWWIRGRGCPGGLSGLRGLG